MTEHEPIWDHWWWRPGWRIGRSFYTWHITFVDQPDVRQLVTDYAPVLAHLPILDPVPPQWLHLTLQGVGFTDEVARIETDRVVFAAQKRCSGLAPFSVTVGPAGVGRETIQMSVRPVEPLAELRRAIRSAIGDVWGHHNIPEPEDGFRPHVSLAYSNTTGPTEPLAEALRAHPEHTADVTISSVSLIDLNRDNQAYEWTDVATVLLGTPSRET